MKNKVLVFDDCCEDYLDICNSLKEKGFDVDNNIKKLQEGLLRIYNYDFLNYVIEEIDNNKTNLAGIFCDYHFCGTYLGTKIIEHIRTYKTSNKKLDQTCKTIPIIACSYSGDYEVGDKMIKSGANKFIHKDFIEQSGKVLEELIKN